MGIAAGIGFAGILDGGAGATGLARPFCVGGGGGGAGARDAAGCIAGFGGAEEPGKGFAAGGLRCIVCQYCITE